MPPEDIDDTKKRQGVWGKYRNFILIGAVILVIVLIGVGIKLNSTAGSSITLTSLSNQLQAVQTALTNQATAIAAIPKTDSVADVSGIQESINEALAKLDATLMKLDSYYSVLDNAMADTYGLLLALNQTLTGLNHTIVALNETVWANHDMLLDICVALNISGS